MKKQRTSFLRNGLFGFGFLAGAGMIAAGWWSLAACGSLSDTPPVPDDDASDFDGGFVPLPEDAAAQTPPTVDAGPPPASGRVRLANYLQGVGAVDLCTRVIPAKDTDPITAPWLPNRITSDAPNPKPDGLQFGEVSASLFLPVTSATTGQRYQYRIIAVGGACDPDGGAGVLVTISPVPVAIPTTPPIPVTPPPPTLFAPPLKQGGGVTLVVAGTVAPDAGDGVPRGAALVDNLAPSSTSTSLRVVHAVPDMPAFDIVVNGETISTLVGIRYGSAIAQPYATSNTTGFGTINAGVPEGALFTIRGGTTVRTYTIPQRLRRGVASTIFVGGSLGGTEPLQANLCSDRLPPAGQNLADCVELKEAK